VETLVSSNFFTEGIGVPFGYVDCDVHGGVRTKEQEQERGGVMQQGENLGAGISKTFALWESFTTGVNVLWLCT